MGNDIYHAYLAINKQTDFINVNEMDDMIADNVDQAADVNLGTDSV